VLGSAEFALFWTAPFAVAFALLFWIGLKVDAGIAIAVTAVTMLPILMLLCIPAAAILRAATRPPRHSRLAWVANLAGVALLVLAAAMAGAQMWILIDDVKM
jgi:hypothetical protein